MSNFQQLHTLTRPPQNWDSFPRILPNLCNFRIYCQRPPAPARCCRRYNLGIWAGREHRKKRRERGRYLVLVTSSISLSLSLCRDLEIWLCRRILLTTVVSRFCHLNCNFAAAAKRQTFLAICLSRQGVLLLVLGLQKRSQLGFLICHGEQYAPITIDEQV